MTSPLKRMDPVEAAPLGMREGPGPAHYVAQERSIVSGFQIGPGYTSGEKPLSRAGRRLVRPWLKKDKALQRERQSWTETCRKLEEKKRAGANESRT